MGSESKDKTGDGGIMQDMSPETKKLVQSVKEIVSSTGFTEQEIHDMLVECDMDADRAIERLLAIGTFHKVKSKRRRRKEKKEAIDSRPSCDNVDLSCGGKTSSEPNVQGGSTHLTSSEHGKAAEKGEVGSVCPSVTSSMTCVTRKDIASDSLRTDNRQQSLGSAGSSSRLQPTLLGINKGHLSMADVVRMGTPLQGAISHHSKASGLSASTKPESSLSSYYYDQTHQRDFNHEWPVTEQPVVANESHASKLSALSNANVPSDHFNPQSNEDSLLRNSVADEAQVPLRNIANDIVDPDKIDSGLLQSRHPTMNDTGLASHSDYNLRNTGSTNFHSSSDHQKDVSSAASDIQQLSLRDSKLEVPSKNYNPAVVLSSDVIARRGQYPHFNFGTFDRVSDLTSSATLASHVSNSSLEVKAAGADGGSLAQNLDASHSVYHGDGLVRRDVFKEAAIDKKLNFLSPFQQEPVKHTSPEAAISHEYTTMSSIADPSFQKSCEAAISHEYTTIFKEAAIDKRHDFLSPIQQEPVKCTSPEAAISHEYTTIFKEAAFDKKHDFLSPFQQELVKRTSPEAAISHEYTTIFKEAIDKKHELLSFLQQEPVKCTSPGAAISHEYTTMSSIADASFQKSQWMPNPLPFKWPGHQNGNMSTFSQEMVMEPRSSLPQRSAFLEGLRAQSFQQLEPNVIRGYLPQSQNQQYLPPVAEQAFLDSSAYSHSLADMNYSHPQNRKEFTMSRLPPARGRDVSGYGNSGSYNPGRFLPNSSIGSMVPSINRDDILPSQYTNGRNGSLIQQHGGFSTWDHGQQLGSMPQELRSMRYSSLGQPRQALTQYGTPGYSDLNHSRAGLASQLQRQVGSQDFSFEQSHQSGNTATSSLHSSHNMPPFFR